MVKRTAILILLACGLAPAMAAAQGWRSMLGPGDVGKSHSSVGGDCDACHVKFQGVPDQKCLEPCHSVLTRRIQKDEGFHATVQDQKCIACHTDHKGPNGSLTTRAGFSRFDHAKTEFPLSGKHDDVQCTRCHTQPIGEMGLICGSCHDDVHEGALGDDCTACHVDIGWKEKLRTKGDHRLRQDGGHGPLKCADCHAGGSNLVDKVSCAGCHTRAHGGTKAACDVCHKVAAWKPATFSHSVCTCSFPAKHQSDDCLTCHPKWRFTPTPTLCSGCHLKERTHDDLGECSLCHQPDTWKARHFNHNKHSEFKLTGRHLRVDCQACHPKGAGFREAPAECAGCHADAGEEAHGVFAGRPCTQCHSPDGWDQSDFDHASTGFPLTGQHGKLECRKCHPDKAKDYPKKGALYLPGPREGRILFAALQTDMPVTLPHSDPVGNCVHCHEDPHRGQVGTVCRTCHQTEQWKPSTFTGADHVDTDFPLKGKHEAVECANCHTSADAEFVFKLKEDECAECHHDPHRRQLGKKCESCHNEEGFTPVPGFDHAVTGFRLERTHQAIGCGSCHTGDPPEQRCGGCHLDPHAGQLGQDCAECHVADRFTLVRFDHDQAGWALRGKHYVIGCSDCHANETWVGLRTECFDCHAHDAARGLAVFPIPDHMVGAGGQCNAPNCHPSLWTFKF